MKHALLLLTLFAAQAQAQIIYTDVIPDEDHPLGWTNDTCLIDLDNDGTVDFDVRLIVDSLGPACPAPCLPGSHTSPTHVLADPMNGNEIADSAATFPAEFDQGEPIDASLVWDPDAAQLLIEYVGASCQHVVNFYFCFPTTPHGDWGITSNGFTTGFLGLRFFIGANRHYGWARFSIHRNGTGITKYTLHDYAYNSVPDEFILAGDTGIGSSTNMVGLSHPSVRIVPNPTTGKFTIEGQDKSRATSLVIRNAMGQEVLRSTLSSPHSEIDLTLQPSGVYFFTIGASKGMIMRKLVKE